MRFKGNNVHESTCSILKCYKMLTCVTFVKPCPVFFIKNQIKHTGWEKGKMGMKEGLIVLPTLPLGKSVISPCRGNKHSYNEQKEYYATAKRIHYFYSPFKL